MATCSYRPRARHFWYFSVHNVCSAPNSTAYEDCATPRARWRWSYCLSLV